MPDGVQRYRAPRSMTAALLALGGACAVGANAQVVATSEYLQRMDADGDGRIALPEYQDWMSYAFDAMDTDRNGQLTADEQPGGRGKPVTRDEHRTRLAERFKRQDLNRDGYLNAKELAAPPQ